MFSSRPVYFYRVLVNRATYYAALLLSGNAKKIQDLYGAFNPKSPTTEGPISELAKNILQLIPSHITLLLPKRHGCSDGIGSLSFENYVCYCRMWVLIRWRRSDERACYEWMWA